MAVVPFPKMDSSRAIDVMLGNLPEQRSSERITMHTTAELVLGADKGRVAWVRDVSKGGMFVYADLPVEPGQPVRLKFNMPALGRNWPVQINGVVLRVERGSAGAATGFAVQFNEEMVA